MNKETIDRMTSDELSRYMVEKKANGEISGDDYIALYDVYCAKRKAEATGETPSFPGA